MSFNSIRGGRSRSRSRSQRGGQSAWQYQLNNVGNGWQQFMNTFSTTGPNGLTQSNNIVPNTGVAANAAPAPGAPGAAAPTKGGRRRRYKNKKGGNWGAVLGTAAVPMALLGMQQMYGKYHTRKHSNNFKNKSRRRR